MNTPLIPSSTRHPFPPARRLALGALLALVALLPVLAHATGGGGSFIVTTAPDHDDGACTSEDCTLREAVRTANEFNAANGNTGATIAFSDSQAGGATNFHDGNARTIALSLGQLILNGNVSITGPGAKLLTLRNTAPAGPTSRVFLNSTNINATLSGLTITGGDVSFGDGIPIRGGGGIFNRGLLKLIGCTVSGNKSAYTGNSAGTSSGGAGIHSQNSLTLIGCTISENEASRGGGGGIDAYGSLILVNTTVSGNKSISFQLSSGGKGGGIQHFGDPGDTMRATNSTIAFNTASGSSGVGGGVYSDDSGSQCILRNTIVASNSVSGNPARGPDVSGPVASAGHNLIGNTANAVISGVTTGDILNQPALLAPLAGNGGPIRTHALLPNSLATNAGSNALAVGTDNHPLTTDQRGAGFARIFGAAVDIGAYEYADTDGDGVEDFRDNCPTTPNPEKIAFASNRDGNQEIYVMNADGSNQVRLTNNPANDSEPSFSRNGSKIAFVSSRDSNSEIYVMNADGTNQTRLTNNATVDGTPTFSPDGSKIAFRSFRDGNSEIYVMNADGSNQMRLTNNSTSDLQPTFSPDGSKIAFRSLYGGYEQIFLMNADGSNQINLSNSGGHDVQPTFSPDGSKLAFSSFRDGNFEIYVMNADGTNQMRLTNIAAVDFEPSFSPDGSKIAFRSQRHGGTDIYVMNADGTNQMRLSNNPGSNFQPSWSGQADSDGDGLGDACETPPSANCAAPATIECGQLAQVQATVVSAHAGDVTVSLGEGGTTYETQTLSGPLTNALVDFAPVALPAGSHTLTVTVTDPAGSSSCATSVTVNQIAQNIQVVASAPASAAFNSSFTVAATGGGSGNPVTYSSAGACTNSGATFTMTSGFGACTVKYNQAGSGCYNPAAEVTQTVTAQKASATVALGALNFSYDGTPHATSASTNPAGLTVNLTYDGSPAAPTNAGSYAVVASIADDNYEGSASDTLTIAKAETATTVTCPSSVPYTGAALTPCSANVTGPGGLNQSLPVNYANNINAGMATANASYPGDSNYNASNHSGSFTIAQVATTVSVTASKNPSVVGDAISFTATVAPSAASGTVQFKIDGVNFGAPVALTSGAASSGPASTLTAGNHTITAVYSGDTNHAGNTSSLTQTVAIPVKVTGGGTVSAAIHFGFNVKPVQDGTSARGFKGHLEFHDTAASGGGLRFKSNTITTEYALDSRHATFTGTGALNGAAGYSFIATVEDNANQGAGNDRFRLQIYNPNNTLRYDSNAQPGVSGGGLLRGGKIKIHYGPDDFRSRSLQGIGTVLNGTVNFELDVRTDPSGGFNAGAGVQFADAAASSFLLTTESITSMTTGNVISVIGPAMYNGVTGYKLQVDWDTKKRTLRARVFDASARLLYDSKPVGLTSGSVTYTASN